MNGDILLREDAEGIAFPTTNRPDRPNALDCPPDDIREGLRAYFAGREPVFAGR